MPPWTRGNLHHYAIIIVAILVSLWMSSLQGEFPSDDAFIHLRFARNFADTGELAFNPGEKSYSTTSPLWNVMVGLAARATGTAPAGLLHLSRILAAVLLALAALALYWLARIIHDRWIVLVPVLFVLDPYATATVHGGMEQPLFVLLGALGFILVQVGSRGSKLAGAGAAMALVLQYAARPEALAFVAAAGLFLSIRRQWSVLAVFSLVAIAMFIPLALTLQSNLGSIVPLSMLMKTHDASGWMPFTATDVLGRLIHLFGQVYAVPLALTAALLVFGAADRARTLASRSLLVLLLTGMLGGAYFAYLKENAVASRYFVNFVPFLIVALGGAFAELQARRWSAAAAGVLVLFMIAGNLAAAPRRTARGLQLEPERIEIGVWLRDNTPATASVWIYDIGYVGFYSERRIYDFNLVRTPDQGLATSLSKRQGLLDIAEAIRASGIEYLVWGTREIPDIPMEPAYQVKTPVAGRHRTIYRILY